MPDKEIKPIAMPGTHRRFLEFFISKSTEKNLKILDAGAGHGALTQKLHEAGYDVSACDLFPEIFHYDKVECRKVDVTLEFPYNDNSFEIIIAVELSEHIIDHEVFFKEAERILKPGGRLYVSTPNILSLKSRMRFLLSGFHYSFNQLEKNNFDGLQHVASLTLDQYNYVAVKNGFSEAGIDIDKKQRTSLMYLVFLFPLLRLYNKLKKIPPIHNRMNLLTGRLLFLTFTNNKKE